MCCSNSPRRLLICKPHVASKHCVTFAISGVPFQYGVLQMQSTIATYNARVCILGLGVLCASSSQPTNHKGENLQQIELCAIRTATSHRITSKSNVPVPAIPTDFPESLLQGCIHVCELAEVSVAACLLLMRGHLTSQIGQGAPVSSSSSSCCCLTSRVAHVVASGLLDKLRHPVEKCKLVARHSDRVHRGNLRP